MIDPLEDHRSVKIVPRGRPSCCAGAEPGFKTGACSGPLPVWEGKGSLRLKSRSG